MSMKRSVLKTGLLAAVILSITAGAYADPPVQTNPTDDPIPRVFCIRITDVEECPVPDATPGNDFVFSFEILNWTNAPASSFMMAMGAGTSTSTATIVGAGVDRDGRGGPLGGFDIDAAGPGLTSGFGTTEPVHFHNGAGSVLRPNLWSATAFTPTSASWSSPGPPEDIEPQDLIGVATPLGGVTPVMLIPSPAPFDATGDTNIDGGAGTVALQEDGVTPLAAPFGNSLDGLTLTIKDFEEGDRIQLNWFMLDPSGAPIGTAGLGNAFGFGSLALGRVRSDGTHAGPALWGNTGMSNNPQRNGNLFFNEVWFVPGGLTGGGTGSGAPPGAAFVGEPGAGITGPFIDPSDNTIGAGVNTNPLTCGRFDPDCDGDTDTVDLTNAIINFTGAGGIGKFHGDGNTDSDTGDQDVDTVDLTGMIGAYTGASAANPNVPDLVYDPATGNVTIDADGADVISFSLQSGPFNAADFSELPAGLTDNIASQIGWTSFNLFSGLTGTANLGAILPAGLDQAGLEAALTTASYGLALAGGGGGGRLDLIIPEPASMVLMGLGAVALVRRRRAA